VTPSQFENLMNEDPPLRHSHPIRRKFIYTVIIAFIAAIVIKGFFFEAFKIPTGSMENTLLPGDFIVVNKSAYSLDTPANIPLTGIPLPSVTLIEWSSPEINDIIVFEFPGNKEELFPLQPANYIKRVAGTPGDTIEIRKKILYINNKAVGFPSMVKVDTTASLKWGVAEKKIYPGNNGWNSDYYGPIIVPASGMTIEINPRNIHFWQTLLDREYGKRVVSVEGTVVNIDGVPSRRYTFKKNYFFVLGDNRDDSMDSRYWGFVSDDRVIGKAMFIYWSWNNSSDSAGLSELFSSIRYDRILNTIK
jgi:signal peptidase I